MKDLTPGKLVYVIPLKRKGRLSKVRRAQRCEVFCDGITVTVSADQLKALPETGAKGKPTNRSVYPAARQLSVKQKKSRPKSSTRTVDLHGMRTDEALAILTTFLSEALLRGDEQIEIVHGHGKGLLKIAVHDFLSNTPQVKHYCHPPHNTGATIAYL